MVIDPWLPVGFDLPCGGSVASALFGGDDWQILAIGGGSRALVVVEPLARRWLDIGLIEEGVFASFEYGSYSYFCVGSGPSQAISPVGEAESPDTKVEALAFALALKATRDIDSDSPLQDALYVEKITRLLPTYSITLRTPDAVVLGYWLTGGMSIPVTSFRRLSHTMSWLGSGQLKDVVQAAGFDDAAAVSGEGEVSLPAEDVGVVATSSDSTNNASGRSGVDGDGDFELPGRPELAEFFNEHVVDIVRHRDRYKALGIGFPPAVILHGPPGCGKTFAVERLVDFLGWPSFQIDASSVASPYIHETSKKVAEVFEKAMANAPSVLVIDEMEAFLADRDAGTGQHRVEEVAEFLRRIPEAVENEVLIVAMTNRIDMVDPAIQRRGRFDHVIEVGYASEAEVRSLLDKLLSALPKEADVTSAPIANALAGRPLSDVTFVMREGARLAARAGKDRLDQTSLLTALKAAPARGQGDSGTKRRIGFV